MRKSSIQSKIISFFCKWENVVIILLLLTSFFLGVYKLSSESLWEDEIYSYETSSRSFTDLISEPLPVHPPLYFIFLKAWTNIFGTSEFSLRFPSVIFGILSVPLMYFLGSKLYDKKTGIIASALLAISPFLIYYQQEARMYALLLFLFLAASIMLLRIIINPAPIDFLAYAILLIAGLMTHYFFVLAIIFHTVYFLINCKVFSKSALFFSTSVILGAAACAPWYLSMFLDRLSTDLQYISWITRPTITAALTALSQFMFNFPVNDFLRASLAIALISIYLIFAILRKENKIAALKKESFIIIFAFALPLTFFLVSYARPLWVDRYLIFAFPAFVLLISRIALEQKIKALGFVFLFIILTFNLNAIVWGYNNVDKMQLREAAIYIQNQYQPGDTVITYRITQNTIAYYFQNIPVVYVPKIPKGEAKYNEPFKKILNESNGIFMVYVYNRVDRSKSNEGFMGSEISAIEPSLAFFESMDFYRVSVEHYARRNPSIMEDDAKIITITSDEESQTSGKRNSEGKLKDILGSGAIAKEIPVKSFSGVSKNSTFISLLYDNHSAAVNLSLEAGNHVLKFDFLATSPPPVDMIIRFDNKDFPIRINEKLGWWRTAYLPLEVEDSSTILAFTFIKDDYLTDKGKVIHDRNIFIRNVSVIKIK